MSSPVAVVDIPVSAEVWKAQHLSLNQRLHHYTRASKTKFWRELAAAKCREQGVPVMGRARVEVWFRFPRNAKREVSNLQATSKALVDGVVDAGVLEDDRDEFCQGPDNRRLWPNGPHLVQIRFFDYDEEEVQ